MVACAEQILAPLNEAQQQAVIAPVQQPVLVLAGAGSGKTRVLTHRIAWLIFEAGFNPYQILAVTFTNKAAREMLNRVESLLGGPAQGMWIGTFHSIAHRLLRQHHEEAGLPEDFQIIDQDDQLRLIKRIHKDFNLDETKWPSKATQHFINQQKDAAVRASQVVLDDSGPRLAQLQAVYEHYEAVCRKNGMVDFSELLLATLELLQKSEAVRTACQQRFQYVLIDEFQDTNRLQYELVRMLCRGRGTITVVGDDDQSIYSWRGAVIDHILSFGGDYADTLTVRLEQNYRSSQTILDAANAVIANNSSRLGKSLWSQGGVGQPITVYAAFNETDEARYIAQQVEQWLGDGLPAYEIAILYRSNAQSRQLEDKLLQNRINYRVYGGLRFFDRAEVKDALAYVRLLVNPHDNAAFLRAVNLPARGVGDKSISKLSAWANQQQVSLWQATEQAVTTGMVTGKAKQSLQDWQDLIRWGKERLQEMTAVDVCQDILKQSGLWEYYSRQQGASGQLKTDNLEELLNSIETSQQEQSEQRADQALLGFISQVSLDSRPEEVDTEAVQLMTLHAAKGLEFKAVVICGLEEGLFPHSMCLDQPNQVEEERRLCYVGMTRARERLTMTYAMCRRVHGQESYQRPSRFLQEIPEQYKTEIDNMASQPYSWRPQGGAGSSAYVSRGAAAYGGGHRYASGGTRGQVNNPFLRGGSSGSETDGGGSTAFSLGETVEHPSFGVGTVLNVEYAGTSAQRVQVKFEGGQAKWLATAYANLKRSER